MFAKTGYVVFSKRRVKLILGTDVTYWFNPFIPEYLKWSLASLYLDVPFLKIGVLV